jgi:hypothetical protein
VALHRNKEPRSPNRCAHGKPTKSGFPLPIDTAWVPANRSLPLLQASSFGNDFWQPVNAINQTTPRIFAKDAAAMASMQVEIWGNSPGVPLTPEELTMGERQGPVPPPTPSALPSVGRNQPYRCGNDRKFKKCCRT